MGCGASKTAVVDPQKAPSKPPESLNAAASTTSLTGSRQNVKVRPRKSNEVLQSSSSSTLVSESEITSLESRNNSATSGKSKGSAFSGDSGLGEEYIEKSDDGLRAVATVSGELEPLALSDNLHVGKAHSSQCESKEVQQIDSDEELPRGLKQVKFAEKLISELPDSPSILKRPASRGGMAFDISAGDSLSPQVSAQMPAFSSRSKRKQRPSYQELQEKQRVAEQRKKEHEQMIIERIRAKEERDRQIKEALTKFAEMQTELASIKQKKQEVSSQSRESYLNSLRDKLKEKSTAVEEEKATKKVAPLNKPPKPNAGTKNKAVGIGAN